MKGICEYKIIRDNKEIIVGKKQNVIFDLPALMKQEYLDNIDIYGPSAAQPQFRNYSGSTVGDNQSPLNLSVSEIQNMFKGIRVYDENLSITDPKDVHIPVLAAGPTKNASSPSEYSQSSFASSDSQMTISATWNLSSDKTIKAVGLCHKQIAENPQKVFYNNGYLWYAESGYKPTCPSQRISATKMALGITTSNLARRYFVGANISTPSLLNMSKRLTPVLGIKKAFAYNTYGWSGSGCAYVKKDAVNGDKVYTLSDANLISVYDVATWTLDKTYTDTFYGNVYSAILFTEDKDIYVSSNGTDINFYELSRTDSTITLLTTITPPIACTFCIAVHDTYVAFKEGFICGVPISNGEGGYNVKTFYNYNNSGEYYSRESIIQCRDSYLIPITEVASDASSETIDVDDVFIKRASYHCWFNTTALNFDTPIDLLDGDTFVITYKILLGT